MKPVGGSKDKAYSLDFSCSFFSVRAGKISIKKCARIKSATEVIKAARNPASPIGLKSRSGKMRDMPIDPKQLPVNPTRKVIAIPLIRFPGTRICAHIPTTIENPIQRRTILSKCCPFGGRFHSKIFSSICIVLTESF